MIHRYNLADGSYIIFKKQCSRAGGGKEVDLNLHSGFQSKELKKDPFGSFTSLMLGLLGHVMSQIKGGPSTFIWVDQISKMSYIYCVVWQNERSSLNSFKGRYADMKDLLQRSQWH